VTTAARVHRDLTALFDPRSIAVVGASDDTSKWGYNLARQAIAHDNGRSIHLVNRKGGTVQGRVALTNLREVDGVVDLVAICVPVSGLLDAVDDALAVGARAIVAITAGLSEASEEGRVLEAEVVRRVRAAGSALVGPNCLGVVDTTSSLQLASDTFHSGSVAVLSQSGNVALDIDNLLHERGLGVSRFVSLGNQSDVSLADLMLACADHDGTSEVAIYAEDVRDGRAFVAAARELRARGKAVVLLAPGRSAAAARGAASHTGSLTSPTRVVDAACVAADVVRVHSPSELVDVLVSLAGGRRADGCRVAVFTDGGGYGAIASDLLETLDLEVPLLSDRLGARLRAAMWDQASPINPVDLAGAGEQDPGSYTRGLAELLASDEVDSVLWIGYFGGYATLPGSLGPREITAARDAVALIHAQHKPVVMQSMFAQSASLDVMRAGGVPVFRGLAEAARSLASISHEPHPAYSDVLDLADPAEPLGDTGYVATRALLAEHGVPFPALAVVRDELELRAALASGAPSYPVVLKAMGLLHKSDAGGVILGLRDEEATVAAYRDLVARLDPPAVTVEAMADLSSGVEVIVGVQTDERFGPVVMVGLGGVLTEVLSDVAFALAPLSPATAERLLRSLHGAALLDGVRGRPPVDVVALSRLVSAVADVACAHPELAELEVNPVLVTPHGVVALDARAVPADPR
jgi:acyl-CoA synthetase (NDP forming)